MNTLKKIVQSISIFSTITVLAALYFSYVVTAAGTATLTLSPSSGSYTKDSNFSVTIHVNSGSTEINTIEADLAYNPSQLEFVSASVPNTYASPQHNNVGGNVCIAAAALGFTLTNDQTIATVTFLAKTAGNTTISFLSGSSSCYNGSKGSQILAPSGSDVWNGQTAGATFSVKEPSSPPATTPTATSSGGSAATKAPTPTKSTSNSSSATTKAPNSSTPSSSTTTQQPSVMAAVTSGYMVAIKVTDANNSILKGVKVTLDNGSTAVTDAEGFASFINIKPGKHTVKYTVDGKIKTDFIDVKGVNSTSVQQFDLKPTNQNPAFIVPAAIGLAILILVVIGAILFRKMRLHNLSSQQNIPKASNGGTSSGFETSTVITPNGVLQTHGFNAEDPQATAGTVFTAPESLNDSVTKNDTTNEVK